MPTDAWTSLVDPEDYFDGWNVGIHGIDEERVAGAPTFAEVFDSIFARLTGQVAVCHTYFDRTSLTRASERLGAAMPACRWLNSATVVRRTWAEFRRRGYGLANVCEHLGIGFCHHDAMEDARAAGEVVVRAASTSGLDLDGLIAQASRSVSRISATGDPDGLFAGETVVFTGTLTLPRREAASLAAAAGCDVAAGVTKATSLLVVGDQDIKKLAGHERSHKHRKAEQLRAAGQELRIIGESDFLAMLVAAAEGHELGGGSET